MLQQLPPELRPAFSALWNLDLAFADVIATSSDRYLGAIRLAWWRERLEELDEGRAPAEARLQAVAAELLPRGVSGRELSMLEDAWLPLLQAFPWEAEQVEALEFRGRILFRIGARLLGGDAREAEAAGALWSLVDAAERCSDDRSRTLLREEAREALRSSDGISAHQLRPMTVLAALAASDLATSVSGPARLKAAILHRLLGRIPRG